MNKNITLAERLIEAAATGSVQLENCVRDHLPEIVAALRAHEHSQECEFKEERGLIAGRAGFAAIPREAQEQRASAEPCDHSTIGKHTWHITPHGHDICIACKRTRPTPDASPAFTPDAWCPPELREAQATQPTCAEIAPDCIGESVIDDLNEAITDSKAARARIYTTTLVNARDRIATLERELADRAEEFRKVEKLWKEASIDASRMHDTIGGLENACRISIARTDKAERELAMEKKWHIDWLRDHANEVYDAHQRAGKAERELAAARADASGCHAEIVAAETILPVAVEGVGLYGKIKVIVDQLAEARAVPRECAHDWVLHTDTGINVCEVCGMQDVTDAARQHEHSQECEFKEGP